MQSDRDEYTPEITTRKRLGNGYDYRIVKKPPKQPPELPNTPEWRELFASLRATGYINCCSIDHKKLERTWCLMFPRTVIPEPITCFITESPFNSGWMYELTYEMFPLGKRKSITLDNVGALMAALIRRSFSLGLAGASYDAMQRSLGVEL